MSVKHEKPVKAQTLDRRDQARLANAQQKPWKPSELHKFDKGTRLTDKGQHPKK
jgi:hypothetical protein